MTRNAKLAITAGTVIAYGAVFLYFYPMVGPGIAAAGLLPVAVAGMLSNRRVGIAAGLLIFVLNTLLFNFVGERGLFVILDYGGGPGQLVIVLIGAVTGWISELRQREQTLLAEQRRLAAELHEERDFLNSIMQTSVAAIVVFNAQGEIVFANDRAEDIAGLTKDRITGNRYNAQIWNAISLDGSDLPDENLPFAQVMATGEPVLDIQFAIERPDDQRRLLSVNAAPVMDDSGKIQRVVCSVDDITDRKEMERALRRRVEEAETLRKAGAAVAATLEPEEAFERILEQLECVVPYDTAAVDLLYEDHLELVAGRGFADPDAVIGLRFPLNGDNPGATVIERCTPVVLHNAPEEYPVFRREPHTHIKSWVGIPLITKNRIIGLMTLDSMKCGFFTEKHVRLATAFGDQVAIALENAHLYTRMQELARTDSLTGIANRRALFELGKREIERAQRFGRPLTILLIDIDHFKRVNDTYGHAAGDEVLAELARRCNEQLRAVDVFARYGGEEFAALLSEADVQDACIVAERLRSTISTPIATDAGVVAVTASIGIASVAATNPDLNTVLQYADEALYRAKEAGRDRIVRYDTEFRETL